MQITEKVRLRDTNLRNEAYLRRELNHLRKEDFNQGRTK